MRLCAWCFLFSILSRYITNNKIPIIDYMFSIIGILFAHGVQIIVNMASRASQMFAFLSKIKQPKEKY